MSKLHTQEKMFDRIMLQLDDISENFHFVHLLLHLINTNDLVTYLFVQILSEIIPYDN